MAAPRQPISFLRALVLAGAVGLLFGAPARAQDGTSREVGNWTLTVSKDGKGCFLTRTYAHPGDTTLLLGIDLDGANHLSVLNANWSIKPQDRLKLDFSFSNGSYPKHAAIGMAADGKQGFVTSFEVKFPTWFAASQFLHIARGKVPVERLDLDGSGVAVAELRKCVEAQREKPAATKGGKGRPDDIPKDPFAPTREKDSKN